MDPLLPSAFCFLLSAFILLPVPPLPFRHIAVEGPIGVGKTSLVNLLAKRFRGTKILEDVDNPFLAEFYKDKRGAAFRCQLFFLLSRYDQQRSISQRDLFTELILAERQDLRLPDAGRLGADDLQPALRDAAGKRAQTGPGYLLAGFA